MSNEDKDREKKVLNISSRIKRDNYVKVHDALKLQSQITDKLATASKALTEASILSELLRRHISKDDFCKEINLDRRVRLSEITRTINAARQNVSRVHVGSKTVNKSVLESIDELIRLHSRTSFE